MSTRELFRCVCVAERRNSKRAAIHSTEGMELWGGAGGRWEGGKRHVGLARSGIFRHCRFRYVDARHAVALLYAAAPRYELSADAVRVLTFFFQQICHATVTTQR